MAAAFTDILRAAVADLAAHGYDDRTRVDAWLVKLRDAARAALVPEAELKRRLVKTLGGKFRRHLSHTTVFRRHQGLEQFTLRQIEPSLRRELDRRILASARLITLNRDASIQRTLARFEGWATAIPKGGSRAIDKPEETKDLKKAFASLPFEERRVIIDQGHKLLSSIDNILAVDGGALAAVWHSHWRETNYDYRPEHKKFDKRVFVIRGSSALKDGLIKPAGRFYIDQIEAPAEEPFCRCYYTYLYSLADLPPEMLTAKGQLALRGDRRAAN